MAKPCLLITAHQKRMKSITVTYQEKIGFKTVTMLHKIRKKSQFSQKWICIYFLKILSLEKNDAPVLIFNLEHPVLF